MRKRELHSLAWSLLLVILVFAAIWWLLDRASADESDSYPPPNPAGANPQAADEEPVQEKEVIVRLDVGASGLATLAEGRSDQKPMTNLDVSPPSESIQLKANEAVPEQLAVLREDKGKNADARDSPETKETPETKLDSDAESRLPTSETGTGLVEQSSSVGTMPAIVYLNGELLAAKYPRLEVVWVYDADPTSTDGTPPGVLLEFVLDSSGRLAWKNNRTQEVGGNFESTVFRHPGTDIVRADNPESLELWVHRGEILKVAGLPPETNRLRWGYYRHRAETFFLRPVRDAFRVAVNKKLVSFDPRRGDLLYVTWSQEGGAELFVSEATFVPKGGSPVPLLP